MPSTPPSRRTLPVLVCAALPLLLSGLLGSGCKSKKDPIKEARAMKSCRGSSQCAKGNICVKDDSGKGVCVRPCKGPGKCFSGFECTGNYVRAYGKVKLSYTSKPYCQAQVIGLGKKCGEIAKGCEKGAACFMGTCVKICSKTGKCDGRFKCVDIVKKGGHTLPWMRKKTLYKGCVPASIATGAKCTAGKLPLCQKENACLGGSCAKICKKDDECPTGRKCHPVKVTQQQIIKKVVKTVFDACQPASLAVGKACKDDQWPLCQRGHRCTNGKCAKLCQKNKDCGEMEKCVRITQRYGILKRKVRVLYRACRAATLAEGAKCGKGVLDRCQREHYCHKGTCVRRCWKHEQCAEGKACLGRGFWPKNRMKETLANISGDKGDFYYCTAGNRGTAPRATYNKCKGGKDCFPKHVCVRGRCRPMCKTAKDCPKHMHRAPPCKNVVSKSKPKKRWKVCLGYL